MNGTSARFFGESIEAIYDGDRGFEKRPRCPDAFLWRGDLHRIVECLSEWRDYARRGKMAHNMRESHLAAARSRGSRGVGRHCFRVKTESGRVFDIYYDRAPKDTADGKGSWHLLQESSNDGT